MLHAMRSIRAWRDSCTRSLGLVFATTALAASATCAHAQLHEGDVLVDVQNGTIVTGVAAGGVPVIGERVFATAFGKLPNWTNDPGFDSPAGAFAPGTSVMLDIMDAARVWDGGAFAAIPQEQIKLAKAGQSVLTPTQPMVVAGILLGSANSTGKLHQHMTYELMAPSGDGIYLVSLRLRDQSGALASSETLYKVFGQNADPQAVAAAAQWVRDNLVNGCYADCDGSGTLNVFDYICFGNAYAAGSMQADCDQSGNLNIFDYICFGNAYAAGCP